MPRRPNNQSMIVRRSAGAVVAATGANAIYRGGRALINLAKNAAPYARKYGAKSTLDRKFGPKPKKSRYNSTRSIGPTQDAIGGGNDWTVSKRTVGYKKPNTLARLSKMMEVGMQKSIYRFQGLTNFDTNTGFFPISNWQFTGGEVRMPIHIYDLTSFPNTSAAPVCYGYQWVSTAANSDVNRFNFEGQTPTGTLTPNWNTENGVPITAFPNSRVMRHDWTDVRINFYGPRKRTTKYEVFFVRVKDEFANPLVAGTSNPAIKELFAYLERPSTFSNLQTYQTNVAKKLKIVKKFTYWVSAGQTTDVDTTVGKIKEARIFMRHDKVYNLDWRHEGTGTSTLSHVQADGAHYVQDVSHHNNPWHGSRLMMIIRAFAPERRTGINPTAPVADANIDPTYDILIRNAISTPS